MEITEKQASIILDQIEAIVQEGLGFGDDWLEVEALVILIGTSYPNLNERAEKTWRSLGGLAVDGS